MAEAARSRNLGWAIALALLGTIVWLGAMRAEPGAALATLVVAALALWYQWKRRRRMGRRSRASRKSMVTTVAVVCSLFWTGVFGSTYLVDILAEPTAPALDEWQPGEGTQTHVLGIDDPRTWLVDGLLSTLGLTLLVYAWRTSAKTERRHRHRTPVERALSELTPTERRSPVRSPGVVEQ